MIWPLKIANKKEHELPQLPQKKGYYAAKWLGTTDQPLYWEVVFVFMTQRGWRVYRAGERGPYFLESFTWAKPCFPIKISEEGKVR